MAYASKLDELETIQAVLSIRKRSTRAAERRVKRQDTSVNRAWYALSQGIQEHLEADVLRLRRELWPVLYA